MTERTEAEHIAVLERLKNTWPFEDEVVDSIQWALDKIQGDDWTYIKDGLPVDDVMYDFATAFEGPCIFRNEPLSMISKYAGVYAYRTHREDVPPPVRYVFF